MNNFEKSPLEQKLKNTNSLNINGNNLSIYEILDDKLDDKEKISNLGDKIFEQNKIIDSIIFIKKLNENNFSFLVYERNKTFSEICGNGLGGAGDYINKIYGINEINFITKSGKKINVLISEKQINSEIFCESKNDNLKDILEINSRLLKIKDYMNYYLNEPNKLSLLLNDNNILTNLLQVFSNLINDNNFENFLNDLKITSYVNVSGEPHMFIEINNSENYSKFIIDYYLKAISFLLRNLENGQKSINGDVNFMFYFLKNNGEYKILPSERGVNNGILFDQTKACGSGSTGLGFILKNNGSKINQINIENRSGVFVKIDISGQNPKLLIDKENIEPLKKEKSLNFPANSMFENLRYNLEKNGINTYNKTFQEIIKENSAFLPEISIQINQLFGNILFSSCFHENEYPIDPYKITSSINGVNLCKLLGINSIYSPYFDTLNGDLKDFPNISISNFEKINLDDINSPEKFNGKVFNLIGEKILKIGEILKSDGEKSLKGIKDVLKYIKIRNENILGENLSEAELSLINNEQFKIIIPNLEMLIKQLIGIGSKNIQDTNYGKYILKLFRGIGLYDLFKENLSPIKDTELNSFIIQLVDKSFKDNLNLVITEFIKGVLKLDFSQIDKKNINKIVNKLIQDSFITVFINKNLDDKTKDDFKNFGITTENGKLNKNLSSLDNDFKIKLAKSLELIINNNDFGLKVIKKYLDKIIEKSNKSILVGDFKDTKNNFEGFKIYYQKDELENNFYIGNGIDKIKIDNNYFINIITNPNNIINLQGCIMLMILNFGNIPMIGSERGYREIFIETLRESVPESYQHFINIIESTKLTTDYVPKKQLKSSDLGDYYTGFPAGTDNSIFGDLTAETLFSNGSIKLSYEKLEKDNLSNDYFDIQKTLIFDFSNLLNGYNFEEELDKRLNFLKNKLLNLISTIDKTQEIQEEIKETLLKIEKIEQENNIIREKIYYNGQDIEKLIISLYEKYKLIFKSKKGKTI